MSRGKKLIQGSILRTAHMVLQIIVTFFLMPFLVHSLGDKTYGLWTLVATFMGYYGLLDLGISAAVSRFIARTIGQQDIEARKVIASTSFYLYLILGLVAIVLTLVFSMFCGYFVDKPEDIPIFRNILIIMGVTLALTFPLRVFNGILQSNLRYDISTYLQIIKTLLNAALIVFVIKQGYGLLGVAIVTSFSTILTGMLTILFSYKVERDLSISLHYFRPEEIKNLFGYGAYVFIGQIANILKYRVDSYVIAAAVSLSAVTHYAIALRLAEYFIEFVTAVVGVVSPVFSQEEGKGDFDSIRKKFLLTSKISLFISCFIGLMTYVYSSPFIERWMGVEYLDAYPVLTIMIIPVTLGLCQSPTFSLLRGISKHKVLMYINIFEGICNLILSLILVQTYGIIGVALGTAIPMYLSTVVLLPFYVCRVLEISLFKYYMTSLKNIVLCVCSVIFVWLSVKTWVKPDYLNILLFCMLQTAIYWAAAIMMGFTSRERTYLTGFLKLNKA